MRVLLFASLIALAACQPKEAETPVAEQAAPAEPGAPTQFQSSAIKFEAMSKTSEASTGNIHLTAFSPTGPDDQPSMKLDADRGQLYETDLVPNGGVNARHIDWTGVFGQVVDPDDTLPNGSPILDIHLVKTENVPPNAPNGGLCGKDKTYALAVAFPIGVMNGGYMGIAAFRGDKWPPRDEKALCGVYNYAPSTEPIPVPAPAQPPQ